MTELAAAEPIFVIRDLSVEFHTGARIARAVNEVNLSVAPGERVGIVGESGCGKTATLLAALRLLPTPPAKVTGGSASIGGMDLLALPPAELREILGRDVAMVFQDSLSAFNPLLRMGRQVTEGARNHEGLARSEAKARAVELLERVGIPDPGARINQYPHQLSGGMRQRAMLAMALAAGPKVLIADEPTTALDVTVQAQILEMVRTLPDLAIVWVSHDLGVVAGLADRVLVMYAGRVVEQGLVREIFARARHPYTRGLLASVPAFRDPDRASLRAIPGLPPNLTELPTGCAFYQRCPVREDRCRTDLPPLMSVGDALGGGIALDRHGHAAACWVTVSEPPPLPGGTLGDYRDNRQDGATATPDPRPTPTEAGGDYRDNRQDGPTATPADGAPLLVVSELRVHFPGSSGLRRSREVVKAVDDLSFTVGRGETVGVVGESGCGKSTTGLAVQGLVDPTGGRITLAGSELTKLRGAERRRFRRRVQMVFQDPTSSLNTRMTVGQILEEPLQVHQIVPPRLRRGRVAELLDQVGMPAYAIDRFPHEFSGGQRQRIAIARALAVEPELIVCDEPVAALDVSIRAQVLNLFGELQRSRDLSYLFISHDLSAVYHLSDRILVMYLGRAMELTDRENLYRAPRHPYTGALLSAVPVPDPDVEAQRERILLAGDVPSPLNPPSGCVFRTRCPIAVERCAEEVPEWRDIGTAQRPHLVACHFAERTADLLPVDEQAVEIGTVPGTGTGARTDSVIAPAIVAGTEESPGRNPLR